MTRPSAWTFAPPKIGAHTDELQFSPASKLVIILTYSLHPLATYWLFLFSKFPKKTFLNTIVYTGFDVLCPDHRQADAASAGDPGNGQERVE